MVSRAALLKTKWMTMPDDFFKPLSFGELKVGQKFIGLPQPGDNHGHGGLRGGYFLFVKTRQKIEEKEPNSPPKTSHGRAKKIKNGDLCDFPNSMLVIRIV